MRIIRIDNKGWRAPFEDGFDEVNVSRIADAFGYIWSDAYPGSTIYVGYDTRYRSRQLAIVAAGVLASYGLSVVVSDSYCTMPALGWSVARDDKARGGVMLTASGASSEYGGITARAADGGPIPDEFYDAASRIMKSSEVKRRGPFSHRDLMGPYLAGLVDLMDVEAIRAAELNVVVDPLYGAGRGYLARILRELGCHVHELHGEELHDFGGLTPVPSKPWVSQCEYAVRSFGCDLGIALDGDADRVGLIDENGSFVSPHRLVPLVMGYLAEGCGLRGRVVATYSSSACVRRQAKRLGLEFTVVPMGFTRIYREFVERDVILGADELGGICIPQHLPERDGMLVALLLIECLAVTKKKVSRLVEELEGEIGTMYYVKRDINLDAASIQAFRNILPGLNLEEVCGMRPVSVGHSDGLVLRFEDDSWVQLRPSRTEPLVRANAESPSRERAEALGAEACEEALRRLPGSTK